MISDLIVVLLGLSHAVQAFGVSNSSGLGVDDAPPKKVKRWAPAYQDFIADYPDFDDSFADNQLEVARPFSSSPGNVVFYRPGSRRPSGAVTRTIFNPPSGFIPRVFAAAKAAIATLTGPQTVLSRTTYLSPPRPGITALQLPQGPPFVGHEAGTNAAAAAAAAAVAAVTRSIYEAAGHRANGFYEKGTHLPPSTYNNYGVWPEPSRSPWTSLQPPDITVRIPPESWDHPRPHITDTYGPPSPTWFNQNPIITIDAPRNPWIDNFNKDTYNGWNPWNSNNRNQGNWAQENRIKDWIDEKRMKTSFGRAGGNGGYAAANADTPPNGDSFADAKITANGASAVAAAVWNLGGMAGRVTESKRTKTEVYRPLDDMGRGEQRVGVPRKEQYEANTFSGRIDADLDDMKSDERQCSDDQDCSTKSRTNILRKLFPSRRKP